MDRKVQAVERLSRHNNPVTADFPKSLVKSKKLFEATERERYTRLGG